jgi:hypothetical protein
MQIRKEHVLTLIFLQLYSPPIILFFVFIAQQTIDAGPSHYRVFTIQQTNHSRYDSSGRVISPSQGKIKTST